MPWRVRLPAWTVVVADQGLVAITNLLMSIAVSRSSGLGALGVFALVNVTVLACLGFTRTLLLDPWLASRETLTSAVPPVALRTLVLAAASLTAVVTGLVCAAAADDPVWGWAVLASFLYVLQDSGRYHAFKVDEPARALRSDGALLAVLLLVLLAGTSLGQVSLQIVLIGWCGALASGMIPTRRTVWGRLTRSGVGTWWQKTCRALGLPLLGDSIAFFVGSNVTIYLLASLGSNQQVGLVRVMTSLYSPVAILFTGLTMWLVPAMARRTLEESTTFRHRASLGLSGIAIVITVVMTLFGPGLSSLVFGPETVPDRIGLAISGLSVWLMAVSSPYLASTRVFGRYEPIMAARMVSGLATVALLALVVPARTANAYVALIASQNLAVFITAWRLRHHQR